MARLFEVGAASRERSAPHIASGRLGAQSRFALSPVSETSSGRRRVASLRRPREKSGEVGAYLVQRHVRAWIVKRAGGRGSRPDIRRPRSKRGFCTLQAF